MAESGEAGGRRRPRVLIVNAYFDYDRDYPMRRKMQAMQAVAPAYLAGVFEPSAVDVVRHNEQAQGPLLDRAILGWPDLLVLTGLTSAFDRMLQLTAYARSLNPRVRVVAGGSAVRAMPQLSSRFFDRVCLGDVEELADVAHELFGPAAVNPEPTPVFNDRDAPPFLSYFETTRNCNFACSFCSLTGEGNAFVNLSDDAIRRQVAAMPRRRHSLIVDNNFFGSDRAGFERRLRLLGELHDEGALPDWSALVTADFFSDRDRVRRLRAAGCRGMFTGLESLDEETLETYNKRQNRGGGLAALRSALADGVVVTYGLIADLAHRRIGDVRAEFERLLSTYDVPLPVFVTLPIPLPGTPYFDQLLSERRILPRTKLRDLEGSTLAIEPLDPLPAAARFAAEIQTFRHYRWAIARHTLEFTRRRGLSLTGDQMLIALSGAPLLAARDFWTAPGDTMRRMVRRPMRRRPRTHVSTTEQLDRLYEPAFPVGRAFQRHFEPTFVTNEARGISEDLAADLARPTAALHAAIPVSAIS